MNIHPTRPGGVPPHGAPGAGQASGAPVPARREEGDARATPGQGDRIQISSAARALHGGLDAPPAGTLDAARLGEIAGRIADGTYDRPETRAAVVTALAAELFGDRSGA